MSSKIYLYLRTQKLVFIQQESHVRQLRIYLTNIQRRQE